MDPPSKSQANLFQVYLRLRPPPAGSANAERFLLVEDPDGDDSGPTHITLNPPNDRRRAIEKFAFTHVFEEEATQLDLFQGTKVLPLVEGVLAPHGGDGTDGLLATLGVTGSGKVIVASTSLAAIGLGVRKWRTNLVTFIVPYNTRLPNPTRLDSTRTRCAISIHQQQHC